jgi:mRNA interferase RelE/StbE
MTLGYRITFKKSVSRDLKKISKEETDKILEKIEADLSEKADTYPILTGKFAGLRKYRSGDYRVIYTIIEQDVIILRIRHRREAYR